jgi:hypothetical protein
VGGARLRGFADRFAAFWKTLAGGDVVAPGCGVAVKLLRLDNSLFAFHWLPLPIL